MSTKRSNRKRGQPAADHEFQDLESVATIPEAADLVGCSLAGMYYAVNCGYIAARKSASVWLVSLKSAMSYWTQQ